MKYSFVGMLALFAIIYSGVGHALEVNVINGQSRVNATLNALQAKVTNLTTQVQSSANLITAFSNCGQGNQIYDSNTDTCVSPPPDPAALAATLNCQDGEVIIQENGVLTCKKRMEGCKVCSVYNRVRDTSTVISSTWGLYGCRKSAPVRTTLASNVAICSSISTNSSAIFNVAAPAYTTSYGGLVVPNYTNSAGRSCTSLGFKATASGVYSKIYADSSVVTETYMTCN